MFLVISDDFTGAAEMAGIAIEFGLDVEIQTKFKMVPDIDVIVIDTNTRTKDIEEAVIIIDELLQKVRQYDFSFIYKKIDSVLRGHIVEELSVLLEYYPEKSSLIVPANPSMGRTITNGIYFIDDQPLHETFFSNDPESPVENSDIHSLVNSENIKVLEIPFEIPSKEGVIYFSNSKDTHEINYWAEKINDKLIPAGAADFWRAILLSRGYSIETDDGESDFQINFEAQNTLYVCGSSLSDPKATKERLNPHDFQIVEISEEHLSSDNTTTIAEKISKKVIDIYKSSKNVILGVKVSESQTNVSKYNIPILLAEISSMVAGKIELAEFLVEGGTTASEVVRKMGCDKIIPINQFSQGIIRLQVATTPPTYLTVKPGSYSWPETIWNP